MITTLCHPIRILLRRVLAGATRREWAKRGTGHGASNTLMRAWSGEATPTCRAGGKIFGRAEGSSRR
jgi:hypothetical protein